MREMDLQVLEQHLLDILSLSPQDLSIIDNITALPDHEKCLRYVENGQLLKVALDSIGFGIIIIDAESRKIIYINDAAARMIGENSRDVVQSICHQYICPAEAEHCPVLDLGQKIDNKEEKLLKVNGMGIPVIKSVIPAVIHNRKYLIESFIDISERKLIEENLLYLSIHDKLTGLYNRAYFEEEVRRLDAQRGSENFSLLVCDLNGLKFINDSLGHQAGDKLLVIISQIIISVVRKGDVVSRIGGDEFAVISPGSDELAIENIVTRIRAAIDLHNQDYPELPLSASIGSSTMKRNSGLSFQDAFREADEYMYKEKIKTRQSTRSGLFRILSKAMEARGGSTEKRS